MDGRGRSAFTLTRRILVQADVLRFAATLFELFFSLKLFSFLFTVVFGSFFTATELLPTEFGGPLLSPLSFLSSQQVAKLSLMYFDSIVRRIHTSDELEFVPN